MTADATLLKLMKEVLVRLDRIEQTMARDKDEIITASNEMYQRLSDQIQEVADALAAHIRSHP